MDTTSYNLGKRDALAEIFMLIRANDGDFKKIFTYLIDQYKKIDAENPHCIWLDNFLLYGPENHRDIKPSSV